jgi:hypothetical protein
MGAGAGAGVRVAPVPPPGPPGVPGSPSQGVPQGSPQGQQAPLGGNAHGNVPGPPKGSELPVVTRTKILSRAKRWLTAKVPYSMEEYWTDGYRQDCSGFVSMAWGLGSNEWTGSLAEYGVRITRDELLPGDMLLFHNPDNPTKGSHVVIFGGWVDERHTEYVALEQTRPVTRRQVTPYGYWSHSARYVPYRYRGLAAGSGAGQSAKPASGSAAPASVTASASAEYPGADSFGPGADNRHVTLLGEMLLERGGARFYTQGPGPRWSDSDRRAVAAFQRAQGWSEAGSDGLPGPLTWEYLIKGLGRDIPSERGRVVPALARGSAAYPGRDVFRPGRASSSVEQLGRQLQRKGYGRFYAHGPGPRWGESDRRAVAAFQRAQGWHGAAADGHPGPETWRRLFA